MAGRFRFGLLSRVKLREGSEIDLWSPRDALVLKCLAWLLGDRLGLSQRCAHLKGHGGARAAVRAVRRRLGENRFVLKTDVASYYASIDHEVLLDRLERIMEGFRLSPAHITVAEATWKRFCERALRLYEQDRREPCGSPRLDAYVRRWCGWARGGLHTGAGKRSGLLIRAP